MGNKLLSRSDSELKDECIRVPKVYDWVAEKIDQKVRLSFSEAQLEDIACALEDPDRRPLRIVVKAPKTPPLFPLGDSEVEKGRHKDFYCEQVGEKQAIEGLLNGYPVDAQLVNLLFTANITVCVVDREGKEVAQLQKDVCALEPIALCYPDGTNLLCRVSKISARILSDSVILNGPFPETVKLKVFFCADIQVEAEVKLSIKAKFCHPRGNDIDPVNPDYDDSCPEIEFPEQCDDIFPQKRAAVSAHADASGPVGDECAVEGLAAIKAAIYSNNLERNSFSFKYSDPDDEQDEKAFAFTATRFDPDSIETFRKNGYSILKISGEGETDGKQLDFELDLASGIGAGRFRVKFLNQETGDVTFNTGLVEVSEGKITVNLG